MSATGAELAKTQTNLGQCIGVNRFCSNPRGTLNSSNSLIVKFHYDRPQGLCPESGVLVRVCREADSIRNS